MGSNYVPTSITSAYICDFYVRDSIANYTKLKHTCLLYLFHAWLLTLRLIVDRFANFSMKRLYYREQDESFPMDHLAL